MKPLIERYEVESPGFGFGILVNNHDVGIILAIWNWAWRIGWQAD